MVRPLAPHPWFVEESRQPVSGVQVASVSLDRAGRMPHLAESGGGAQICVLDGEFYNRQELRRALGADGVAARGRGWTTGRES